MTQQLDADDYATFMRQQFTATDWNHYPGVPKDWNANQVIQYLLSQPEYIQQLQQMLQALKLAQASDPTIVRTDAVTHQILQIGREVDAAEGDGVMVAAEFPLPPGFAPAEKFVTLIERDGRWRFGGFKAEGAAMPAESAH